MVKKLPSTAKGGTKFLLLGFEAQKLRYKEDKEMPSSLLQKMVQNVDMFEVIKGQKLVRQK
ncbi:hypothetical protein Ddye_023674 [Dipteronia dyeriana]|uniref:Uncharacterized protein n=1 Tax=Dipteronia dyeriana TaxID=168575 RepID=A0AAD9WSV6_9ROSI|nr:hypothetical protein Ddye_023674 [Dipteronia dyeriana]